MPALIPALIQLFMSRARGGGGGYAGGGGGGGGMPKPQKSAAEKDDDYWAKAGMSNDGSESALTAAIKAQPKVMTWDDALRSAKGQ